jgi:hypothetical protein
MKKLITLLKEPQMTAKGFFKSHNSHAKGLKRKIKTKGKKGMLAASNQMT